MADGTSALDDQFLHALGPAMLRGMLSSRDPAIIRLALEAFTQIKGPDDPDTMRCTCDLVSCLLDAHEVEEALPLAQHALDYWQRMYGLDPEAWSADDGEQPHQMLWISMFDMTSIFQRLRRFDEAEPLHIKLLDITQRVKGPEHPDTIQCCECLGVCWLNMGKYDKAEGMLRRVLDFNTRLLGPEHQKIVMSYMNLGRCLTKMGKLEEGEQVCRRAVAVSIRARGLQHTDTFLCMYILGRVLACLGRYAEAEPLARKALEGYTRKLGANHPDTRGPASLLQELAQAKAKSSTSCGVGSGSSSNSRAGR